MTLMFFLFIISISVYTNALPIEDDEVTAALLLEGENHKPPHFSQSFYKATVLEDYSIDIMDGPIVFENVHGPIYFVISSDNYEDYTINVNLNDSKSNQVNRIQLDLTSTEPSDREFDVIILEALNQDTESVGRTTILLVNSRRQFDMYKMRFIIDGSEYIVLNYHYFKWFLGLLTITGILILAIECHYVAQNVKTTKQRKEEVKYKELQDI